MDGHKKYKPTPKKFNIVSQFCQLLFDDKKFKMEQATEYLNTLNLAQSYTLKHDKTDGYIIADFKNENQYYTNPLFSTVKYDDGVLLKNVTLYCCSSSE